MRRSPAKSTLAGLAACVSVATGASAQDDAPSTATASLPTVADRFERVEACLAEERERQRIPGVSVAVLVPDLPIWSRAYGLADVENDVPATPQTVFRIGSISRMVTAVAALQLVERGKIPLNSSVRDYVPELPDKGARITLEHLLPHLSGIRTHTSREEFYNRERFDRLVDALAPFKNDPLITPPGGRFLNTPFGYTLVGLVVERVGGVPFGEYLKRNIFEPAGMTHSDVENLEAIVPRRARGYTWAEDSGLRNAPFADLSVRVPADGLVSTAEDLARFAAALLDHKLLTPPFVKLMTTEYRTSEDQPVHYGLGCFVREHTGRRIIGHGGWQPQVSTFLLIAPQEHFAVAVLANLEQADVQSISLTIMDTLLAE